MDSTLADYDKWIEQHADKPYRVYKVNVHLAAVSLFIHAGFAYSKEQPSPSYPTMEIRRKGAIKLSTFKNLLLKIAPEYLWIIPPQHTNCKKWNKDN